MKGVRVYIYPSQGSLRSLATTHHRDGGSCQSKWKPGLSAPALNSKVLYRVQLDSKTATWTITCMSVCKDGDGFSMRLPASLGRGRRLGCTLMRHAHMSRLLSEAPAGGAQLPEAALCRMS